MEFHVGYMMFTYLLLLKSAFSQQSSPVIVRESNTARFIWQIPAGESYVTIYVVSPSGSAVLFANAANQNQTGSNYRSRVTYTGDLSVRNMAFDLRDVVRSDAGTYMCGRNEPNVVIDDCGQKLIVLGLPTKPNLQGQLTPVLGSQMTLTCSSTSTTLPGDHGLNLTYNWQRDNSVITVTSPSSSYTFTVISRDTHRYRCRATESQGLQSQWSSEYLLQPEYSPYNVSLQPPARSYTKTEGEESVPSITCSAGCRPGCTYSWYKDGTIFTSGATLNFGLANRTQTGSYQCRAINKHGTEQGQNVVVDIKYPPETPTNVTVTAESSTSLSVSWRRGFNGGAHQKFTVEYSRDNIILHRTGSVEETSDKEYYSSIVSNLHPSTVYFLRVYAENKFGNSSYTEIHVVLTVTKIETPDNYLGIGLGIGFGVCVPLLVVSVITIVILFILYRRKNSILREERKKRQELTAVNRISSDPSSRRVVYSTLDHEAPTPVYEKINSRGGTPNSSVYTNITGGEENVQVYVNQLNDNGM